MSNLITVAQAVQAFALTMTVDSPVKISVENKLVEILTEVFPDGYVNTCPIEKEDKDKNMSVLKRLYDTEEFLSYLRAMLLDTENIVSIKDETSEVTQEFCNNFISNYLISLGCPDQEFIKKALHTCSVTGEMEYAVACSKMMLNVTELMSSQY